MKTSTMIESTQNDKIKYLVRLNEDNRYRKKAGVVVVEGRQENERALHFGYENIDYYLCETLYDKEIPKGKIHFVNEKVYEKIAYRGSSEGIIGVYKVKENDLESFIPQKNSSIIVVEGTEKPGNLGAILRSCEAFGIDALIITDPKTDIYNPNVLRSSVGCLFGMNIFMVENEMAYHFFKENQYPIYSTYMSQTAKAVYEKDLTEKSAIIFGTEHSGISEYWLEKSENILIPMENNRDTKNIIQGYIRKSKNLKIIKF